ncbi:MAG: response regulator [Deltaproteobacteria bacterium]|nr:response regulator [Deltaproteobacteria bacterium]
MPGPRKRDLRLPGSQGHRGRESGCLPAGQAGAGGGGPLLLPVGVPDRLLPARGVGQVLRHFRQRMCDRQGLHAGGVHPRPVGAERGLLAAVRPRLALPERLAVRAGNRLRRVPRRMRELCDGVRAGGLRDDLYLRQRGLPECQLGQVRLLQDCGRRGRRPVPDRRGLRRRRVLRSPGGAGLLCDQVCVRCPVPVRVTVPGRRPGIRVEPVCEDLLLGSGLPAGICVQEHHLHGEGLSAQVGLTASGGEMSAPFTILIVDDEEPIRKAIRRVLKFEPYRLLDCGDPVEALRLVEAETVHVVISDYTMPGMLGVDLLRKIRMIRPDTIRIILTGNANLDMAMQAINEGAIYRFLTKPWDNADLQLALRLAQRQWELEDRNRRLLALVSKYRDVIDELERKQPGATGIERDDHGRIVIDDEDLGLALDEWNKE